MDALDQILNGKEIKESISNELTEAEQLSGMKKTIDDILAKVSASSIPFVNVDVKPLDDGGFYVRYSFNKPALNTVAKLMTNELEQAGWNLVGSDTSYPGYLTQTYENG